MLVCVYANEPKAISNDTKLLVELIKANKDLIRSETKANRDLIISYQKATDKRFDDVNKRFEDMNKRFDTIVYIMLGGFTLIMGYLLKERNSIKQDIKAEIEPELIKKADKNILDKVIAIIEDMAKNDKEVEAMLHKHHLKFA